jgi:hypothetical protein
VKVLHHGATDGTRASVLLGCDKHDPKIAKFVWQVFRRWHHPETKAGLEDSFNLSERSAADSAAVNE